MDEEKMGKYFELSWILDDVPDPYTLRLYVVDRYVIIQELDLDELDAAYLRKQATGRGQ